MASDDALDGLGWSAAARGPERCTFESAGWSCGSTGFLWFSADRAGDERLYPCPRCNAELFLAKARQRGAVDPDTPRCICCGPGFGHLAYRSALDEVSRQEARAAEGRGRDS